MKHHVYLTAAYRISMNVMSVGKLDAILMSIIQ